MAKAMKCDICNKFYDAYNHMTAKELSCRIPNRIEFGINFIDNYDHPNYIRYFPRKGFKTPKFALNNSIYDVCPDCVHKVANLLSDIYKENHTKEADTNETNI